MRIMLNLVVGAQLELDLADVAFELDVDRAVAVSAPFNCSVAETILDSQYLDHAGTFEVAKLRSACSDVLEGFAHDRAAHRTLRDARATLAPVGQRRACTLRPGRRDALLPAPIGGNQKKFPPPNACWGATLLNTF